MAKIAKNPIKFTKKHIFLTLGAIILTLATLGAYKFFASMPRDLGSHMHYIGKKDFGCAPFPFFFFCTYEPYSEYYFATDMNETEIQSYFKGAASIRSERFSTPQVNEGFEKSQLGFETKKQDEKRFFAINFFGNSEAVLQTYRLEDKKKLHIISILDSEYEIAKESL